MLRRRRWGSTEPPRALSATERLRLLESADGDAGRRRRHANSWLRMCCNNEGEYDFTLSKGERGDASAGLPLHYPHESGSQRAPSRQERTRGGAFE